VKIYKSVVETRRFRKRNANYICSTYTIKWTGVT